MMLIEAVPVGPLQVNCYIVGCPETNQAMVVDPGAEGEKILQLLESLELQLQLVVNTHAHFDHVGGNALLVKQTGAELLLHPADLPLLDRAAEHAAGFGLAATPSPQPTRLIQEGERVEFGSLGFDILHVPGHSPGGVCLYGHGHLFAGDVLFAGSIGRTDLPGGDHRLLISGIRQKLMVLPAATIVHPGHGPDTTIADERLHNPFIA
jgi:glyoxylase-like metal-dependent hydrolase (beta-lactamase superfamily II)